MKPYLIGIAGPSCAGKSYLARHMLAKLNSAAADANGKQRAILLSLDSYYLDLAHLSLSHRGHANFDAPESLDAPLLIEHVQQLSRGNAIEKPVYDFKLHTRTGQTQRIDASEFIVVEGLFALYWEEIRRVLGTKVFVDLGEQICLSRRIERDTRERGRTRESILAQFHDTVLPMAARYVHPTRAYAQLLLAGDDDISDGVQAVLRHIQAGVRASQCQEERTRQ